MKPRQGTNYLVCWEYQTFDVTIVAAAMFELTVDLSTPKYQLING
ncbi:MAG: hypothetical protein QMD22_07105 [archaeon]|nr:hypothetical protein [archaeon]